MYLPKINIENTTVTIKIYHGKKIGGSILKANCDKENKSIEIGDIKSAKSGKGYGSIMMNELVKYAKEKGYKEIYGKIMGTNTENFKIQKRFYEKYEFIVTPIKHDPPWKYEIKRKL